MVWKWYDNYSLRWKGGTTPLQVLSRHRRNELAAAEPTMPQMRCLERYRKISHSKGKKKEKKKFASKKQLQERSCPNVRSCGRTVSSCSLEGWDPIPPTAPGGQKGQSSLSELWPHFMQHQLWQALIWWMQSWLSPPPSSISDFVGCWFFFYGFKLRVWVRTEAADRRKDAQRRAA